MKSYLTLDFTDEGPIDGGIVWDAIRRSEMNWCPRELRLRFSLQQEVCLCEFHGTKQIHLNIVSYFGYEVIHDDRV